MPPDSPSPDDQTAFAPPPSRATSSGPGWTPPTVEHLQALLPQYEIISMLGHGGMGAVYKGKQKSLDRLVAIKILPPGLDDDDVKFTDRFKNEARTMAKMMHPGIVAVFDFGEIDGRALGDGRALAPASAAGTPQSSASPPDHPDASRPVAAAGGPAALPGGVAPLLYFVMEYVDGTDVAKMIQSSVKLPPDHALAITAHVCDALAYAHANGVIHRDIKPANILINMQGQVKVADFGLAKMDDPSQRGLTMTGMTMGTPDFVAPEALVMGVNVDGRADLYAIGVMLYQMLTGEIPRGLFQMPGELTNGEIDPRFDAIIAKAMQTNREARYQTASAIRKDLDVILTTPRIKQDASQAIAAVPQGAVKNVPGQRSVAQKPEAARAPKKEAGPAAKPSAKSKTGPVIGIAASLVIAGALVFMFSGQKNAANPQQDQGAVASVGGKAAAKPEPIKVIDPSNSKSASAAVSGKTIDLIPLVDLKKDVIVGPWSIKDGEICADRTRSDSDEVYGVAFCTLPYTPPEEFDVDAEFTSHESSQASIVLPLLSAKTQMECSFFYGNNTDRWHSLERLDDLPPYDPGKRKGEAAFKVTKPDFTGRHKAHVEVRRSSIKMVVDDVTVVDWTGDQKRLALSTDYTTLRRLNRIAVGRGGRPMTFHRLSVREVSGAGTLLDGARVVIDPWNDGLAEWWQHMPASDAAGLLAKEAGGSRVNASPVRKAIFPAADTKRIVLTMKATVRDISDFCALYVRHQSPDNYQAVLQKDGTTKIVLTKADGRELARSVPIAGFDATKSHVFEFKADAGTLIVRVDGKETCRALDDTISKKGTFYFTGDSGTLIEKLEYR